MESLDLVSCTAVIDAGEKLNLDIVPGEWIGKKQRFKGKRLKLNTRGAALIFASGKIGIVGATDLDAAGQEVFKVLAKERKNDPEVSNQVFSTRLKENIDLPETCRTLQQTNRWLAIYEPEFFPALLAERFREKGKIQYFNSGRIIVTGVKSRAEAIQVLDEASNSIVKKKCLFK